MKKHISKILVGKNWKKKILVRHVIHERNVQKKLLTEHKKCYIKFYPFRSFRSYIFKNFSEMSTQIYWLKDGIHKIFNKLRDTWRFAACAARYFWILLRKSINDLSRYSIYTQYGRMAKKMASTKPMYYSHTQSYIKNRRSLKTAKSWKSLIIFLRYKLD